MHLNPPTMLNPNALTVLQLCHHSGSTRQTCIGWRSRQSPHAFCRRRRRFGHVNNIGERGLKAACKLHGLKCICYITAKVDEDLLFRHRFPAKSLFEIACANDRNLSAKSCFEIAHVQSNDVKQRRCCQS